MLREIALQDLLKGYSSDFALHIHKVGAPKFEAAEVEIPSLLFHGMGPNTLLPTFPMMQLESVFHSSPSAW